MKKYFLFLTLFFLTAAPGAYAQSAHSTIKLPFLQDEQWWAATTQYGYRMPFNSTSSFSFDLYGDVSNNQSAPLLLSSKGRWVWCDDPFVF
jgi:hypothetical protein